MKFIWQNNKINEKINIYKKIIAVIKIIALKKRLMDFSYAKLG